MQGAKQLISFRQILTRQFISDAKLLPKFLVHCARDENCIVRRVPESRRVAWHQNYSNPQYHFEAFGKVCEREASKKKHLFIRFSSFGHSLGRSVGQGARESCLKGHALSVNLYGWLTDLWKTSTAYALNHVSQPPSALFGLVHAAESLRAKASSSR